MKQLQHLILYDGTCGFCNRMVQILLKIDQHQLFAFAPLQGPTAQKILSQFPSLQQIDSSILVEDFQTSQRKIYVEATSLFRIFWLMRGGWKFLGCFFFLPAGLFNWIYRFIARHRYSLVAKSCLIPKKDQKNRFLP